MGKAELTKCTAQNEQLRTTCAPTAMCPGESLQGKKYKQNDMRTNASERGKTACRRVCGAPTKRV